MQQIESLVPVVDWSKALTVWSLFADFPHSVTVPKPETEENKCESVEFCAEDLNVTEITDQSHDVDCNTSAEQVHDRRSVQNILPCTETDSQSGTVDTVVDASYLKTDVNVYTDDIDRNLPFETGSVCDKTKVSLNEMEQSDIATDTCLPSFRATCYRTGSHHCFQSPSAAAHFGGAVQDYFGWKVDLSNYDIEVVMCIEDTNVRIGISLTKHSLHRRHITHFGRTTLRPTIAHGMLR